MHNTAYYKGDFFLPIFQATIRSVYQDPRKNYTNYLLTLEKEISSFTLLYITL